MQDFVHLHVHTQYSILDGQASISRLIDKAIGDGMKGMAVTDHGNMFGIKEFFNTVNKVNDKNAGKVKEAKKLIEDIDNGTLDRLDRDGKDKYDNKPEAQLREEAQKTIDKTTPKLNFKPIFGCEMYCARRSMHLKDTKQDSSGWHLIVLAKNNTGYHNLVKLVSHAWTDGFYSRPRTDHEELKKYHEGLIICSACIAGELPSYVRANQIDKAEETIAFFKGLFGDDYYIELQRHEVKNPTQRANRETYELQKEINKVLIELAHKHNVKLVCTNDVHFVDEENAEAHDRLICLSTGKDLDDPNRMLYSKQEWFKTRAEMNEIFSDVPEALSNTIEVLNKVETYSIDHAPIMPNFAIPEDFGTEEEYRQRLTEEDLFNEFTQDENGNVVMSREDGEKKIRKLGGYDKLYRIKFEADYLGKLAYDGAKAIYGDPLPENVAEQIKFELHIMKTMGFPGYFLIVQDYINTARNELGVWVGPGRGSAAGSVVAYCLGITRVDPVKYDLLFERFLNPDRISLPDIDVDFDDDGRGKVLQWVTDKYGAEKVAHIITYGSMATKSSIKDVARVQKLPLPVSNALCKAIPDKLPTGDKMSLPNAIKCVEELKQAYNSTDPVLRDTIKYAVMLENNIRNTGVHACGFIICRDEISDWVPVSTAKDKDSKEELHCTQYDGHYIEETGLIKMDFLGLKTLSILKEAVENVRDSLGIDVDVEGIDIEDPATYQLYCDGRTIGTFQFESPGMQKYLRELQPSVFEDLIAMNALYRPGPMDYIPDFIDRKQGRKPITYPIPCMEKYLKDTYGITVYQEQVMLLSRQLADFTRGESDALRKAMGKKKKNIVDEMKPKFIEGGKKNGHDPAILEKIWADWEKFASYAFNKSHATCYSWVAYQTAYMKAHYPAQYMAANMSRSLNNISDISKFMDECKAMGISTFGPDVNESQLKFSVNQNGDIRFGMAAVKGVGESVVDAIVSERKKNGLYKDVFDFVQRVNLNAVNRKALESLVLSGAFDSLGVRRESFFAPGVRPNEVFLDTLIRFGQKYQADLKMSMNTLFGNMGLDVAVSLPVIPEAEPWSDLERLNKERDLVGIYLSAHPLDEYVIVLNYVCNTQLSELQKENYPELAKRTELKIGGIVTDIRMGTTKKGNPYGIVKLENYKGTGEIALFGQDWLTFRNSFMVGTSLFIRAKVAQSKYGDRQELQVKTVQLLSDVKDSLVEKVRFDISLGDLTPTVVEELSDIVINNPGDTEVFFHINTPDRLNDVMLKPISFKINFGKEFLNFFDMHEELSFTVNGF
ncbi:MAG: DNA polymerase III subunit alpha [Bacteroidaceae bacterium]|nr:DNA polymerase III subunit alpha [Bacteroidaceae bacterium]